MTLEEAVATMKLAMTDAYSDVTVSCAHQDTIDKAESELQPQAAQFFPSNLGRYMCTSIMQS